MKKALLHCRSNSRGLFLHAVNIRRKQSSTIHMGAGQWRCKEAILLFCCFLLHVFTFYAIERFYCFLGCYDICFRKQNLHLLYLPACGLFFSISALLIVSALLTVKDILLFSVFTQKYRKNSVGFLLHWHTHEDIRYSCLFLYVFFLQAFFTQKLQLVSMQWKNRLFSDHTVPFCVKNARFDSAETDR